MSRSTRPQLRSEICLAAAALAAGVLALSGQQTSLVQPTQESGQSVTPAYEGWFANPDGTFSILFGYFNRNTKQELDIPVGPANRIEPSGPDRGQPTHFLTRRQWGLFAVKVPKDFGKQKITWSLTSNGKTNEIPAGLDPLWELAPFLDATKNTPPYLAFAADGPFANGPLGTVKDLSVVLPDPVTLDLWTADDASVVPGAVRPRTPAVTLAWSKYRGPGAVRFVNERPSIEAVPLKAPATVFTGKASTTATFSEPGEYTLRIQANDWSGDGGRGFQCCWSNAQVKVSVKPAR
ncbi:MAG: hypothetical protein ABI811_10615 [Acidobacteriota bacterium]